MPELPEVETVRTGLEKALKGATIESVTLRRKGLRIAFPKDFAEVLEGRTFKSIERVGKYLLFHFDSSDIMLAHLGMSGRFLLKLEKPKTFLKHDHAMIALEDGRCIIFNDPRRFGLMTLTDTASVEKHELLKDIGPDPFSKEFSAAYLKKALSSRTTAVKAALMDQKLVAGVGNIYASEALFLAHIDPKKRGVDAADQAAPLVEAIRKVLKAAIASGGSSLRDFVKTSGKPGYFQNNFNVYDRAGKKCRKCSTPIKEFRMAGRSTFFCPRCQK